MPELTAIALLALLGAYLIGSLSSAVMLCKVSGLPDPRTQGSGNPGATNVLRMGSKKLAAMVLLIDVLKGVVPVLIGRMLDFDINILALIAFFAFLGHLYPVFKGGKGVATALGAFLALSPALAGAALLTWIVVFAISRISSLSAIAAAAMTPVYSLWLIDTVFARAVILVIALLLLWRHRSNIQRLLAGEEKKSG